jgi:hypothetical protein
MTNAEYYGFNSNGYFTKHIDHIPKKVKDMNTLEFLKWLSSRKEPELTASEKKFLTDIVNAYAGLVNIQTVERIYDITQDSYYLEFKDDINSSDSSDTFSCFNGMFAELEEGKNYNIRKLLGKDC